MTNRIESYGAANIFPTKLLQNRDIIKDGRITPYHLQLNPTNRCNLNCSFCSCSDRDKTFELPLEEITEMIVMFKIMGTKSVTITGGGEPLCHPKINEILELMSGLGIAIGIVSNGIMLDRMENNCQTWIRISFSDSRDLTKDFLATLARGIERMPRTNWSFSYVLTAKPYYDKLKKVVAFAGEHNFCHVRIVSDLVDVENTPDMDEPKRQLAGISGEEIVIYQGRKKYTAGRQRCLIGLLKPTIGADGKVYPCCGSQYSVTGSPKDFPEVTCMGHWREFKNIFQAQLHFDGSICTRCYYDEYNTALHFMTMNLEHKEFV